MQRVKTNDLSVAEAIEIVCDIAERSGEVAWLAGKWAASDRTFEAVEILRPATAE